MVKIIKITQTTAEGPFTRTFRQQDYGQDYTDAKLRELYGKLISLYSQAASDLYAKQFEFMHKHEKRVEKYLAQVKAGLITQEDFDAWMRGQLFQERAWALKRGQLAREMTSIDQQAVKLVNEGTLDVFAENANYMGFMIDQQTGTPRSMQVLTYL